MQGQQRCRGGSVAGAADAQCVARDDAAQDFGGRWLEDAAELPLTTKEDEGRCEPGAVRWALKGALLACTYSTGDAFF